MGLRVGLTPVCQSSAQARAPLRLGRLGSRCQACTRAVCSQQACEMVMDILRERDQSSFGDRNEYGSRIGGGIDVSAGLPGWVVQCYGGPADPRLHPSGTGAQALGGSGHRPEWGDDQEDPE